MKCKHCEFINKTFLNILKRDDSSNREYYLMTEVFYYLHKSDVCRKEKMNVNNFGVDEFKEVWDICPTGKGAFWRKHRNRYLAKTLKKWFDEHLGLLLQAEQERIILIIKGRLLIKKIRDPIIKMIRDLED